MEKINILPLVDHGVDIIGDEWEDEEDDPEMEKRNDPDHPYCTCLLYTSDAADE